MHGAGGPATRITYTYTPGGLQCRNPGPDRPYSYSSATDLRPRLPRAPHRAQSRARSQLLHPGVLEGADSESGVSASGRRRPAELDEFARVGSHQLQIASV